MGYSVDIPSYEQRELIQQNLESIESFKRTAQFRRDMDELEIVEETPVAKRKLLAKFRCTYVSKTGAGEHVFLTPVYSADPLSENKAFWDATPSGSIDMYITNELAFGVFQGGSCYYVEFIPE